MSSDIEYQNLEKKAKKIPVTRTPYKVKPSKYTTHSHKKENERRLKQIQKGVLHV